MPPKNLHPPPRCNGMRLVRPLLRVALAAVVHSAAGLFQSAPPREGAIPPTICTLAGGCFNPRPRARGRLRPLAGADMLRAVSIRAPARGGDDGIVSASEARRNWSARANRRATVRWWSGEQWPARVKHLKPCHFPSVANPPAIDRTLRIRHRHSDDQRAAEVDQRRERGRVSVRIVWQTGAVTEHRLRRQVRAYAEYADLERLEQRVRDLNSAGNMDHEIATILIAKAWLPRAACHSAARSSTCCASAGRSRPSKSTATASTQRAGQTAAIPCRERPRRWVSPARPCSSGCSGDG